MRSKFFDSDTNVWWKPQQICAQSHISISCISVVVVAAEELDKDGAPSVLTSRCSRPSEVSKCHWRKKGSLPPRDTGCGARPIRFHCSTGRGVRQSANQTWHGSSRREEALCVLSLYDLISSEQPAVPAGASSSSPSTSDQRHILFASSFMCFYQMCVCEFFFWKRFANHYETTEKVLAWCARNCQSHFKVMLNIQHLYWLFSRIQNCTKCGRWV